MRPPSKRLGHKKSRAGCLRCKARHVKCDEQRPCRNCVRFDVVCSLTHPEQPATAPTPPKDEASKAASPASLGSFSTPGSTSQLAQFSSTSPPGTTTEGEACHSPATWMQSLRLLHHYDTAVCAILAEDEATVEVWKKIVPEAAFSHEFLMHGLLALSALHYAQSHPSQRREYGLISSHYQSLALQIFATKLQDISEDNFEPYFFLATFIFILSMRSISDRQDSQSPADPSDISQSFMLLQGIKSICEFKPIETWSRDGPLAPLMEREEPTPVNHTGAFQTRMDRLYTLARDLSPTFSAINEQSSCLLAIESLRTTQANCIAADTPSSRARRIWLWPVSLTHYFIELISQKHHVALIILAHYAALARPFEHPHWMNREWSSNVFASVENALEEKWHEWISWPKRSLLERIDVDEMEP
ncbi:hypothetical protein FZEAL_9172 [Fusarium zealandicum]|uniref:Zn(2)-C6 fungal-type domain-containing protein n=1 Tax=Fusarium zealandicum TaxID=1053134 RepID=A0A8H4UD20_9HYPO|nr:hypothetical protein FZEAL_9172 [Fusarium zealandicum]